MTPHPSQLCEALLQDTLPPLGKAHCRATLKLSWFIIMSDYKAAGSPRGRMKYDKKDDPTEKPSPAGE